MVWWSLFFLHLALSIYLRLVAEKKDCFLVPFRKINLPVSKLKWFKDGWGAQQQIWGVDLASKFPRSQSSRESVVWAWAQENLDTVGSNLLVSDTTVRLGVWWNPDGFGLVLEVEVEPQHQAGCHVLVWSVNHLVLIIMVEVDTILLHCKFHQNKKLHLFKYIPNLQTFTGIFRIWVNVYCVNFDGCNKVAMTIDHFHWLL